MNFNYSESKNSILRENLQDNFDRSFLSDDFESLREHYRKLRRLEFDCDFDYIDEIVDISALTENLTVACDIVTTDMNIDYIYCGNETSNILGNSKLISKAVLNLLSNAFLHGNGHLVTVKTVNKAAFVAIEVQNGGIFENPMQNCFGLDFVRKVCRHHNGNFFVIGHKNFVKSIMLLPKRKIGGNCPSMPDFCELLNDRLSPVYVEFFGL